jgi:hypothetical protein
VSYSPAEHTLRAHLAAEHRKRNADPQRITELRRQLRERQLADRIRAWLSSDPAPTPAQRRELATLLAGSGADVAA